jgi:hypothetical protein
VYTNIYDLLSPGGAELPDLPPFQATSYTAPTIIGVTSPDVPPSTVSHQFLFGNIDSTVSINRAPAAGAGTARFWYAKSGGTNRKGEIL